MRRLNTLILTNNQKKVLTTIIASATPEAARSSFQRSTSLSAAFSELLNINAIVATSTTAEVTPAGMVLAKRASLVDDADQLTDEGYKYVVTDEQELSDSVYPLLNDLITFIRE